MNAATDAAIDRLELVIADKIRARTGHATEHINVRTLLQQLRFADKTDAGVINAQHFHEFLWSMNVVGGTLAREGEMLFNRYNEDFTGLVDCREFAFAVFGCGDVKRFNATTLDLFHRFRRSVVERGLGFVLSFFERLTGCADRQGFAPLRSLARTISDEVYTSDQELHTLLGVFDVKNTGSVNVTAFVKRMKSGMNSYRKKLVRAVFDHLDVHRSGSVSADEIESFYAVDPRDRAVSSGFVADGIAFHKLRAHVRRLSGNKDEISWPAFLDFYRCMSLGLEDDYDFDLVLRHSWHFDDEMILRSSSGAWPQLSMTQSSSRSMASSGSVSERDFSSPGKTPGSVRRNLLVTHSNGSEEVVEIFDELGRTRLNGRALHDTLTSMGVDDICDIRW